KILDGDLVVIVETALGRDVFAPVIRVALEDDALPRFHLGDRIRPAADHRLQRRLVERFLVEGVLGQDGRQRDDQRKFTVGLIVEGKAYGVLSGLFQLGDLLHTVGIGRAAL